jgi:hypothetical protein
VAAGSGGGGGPGGGGGSEAGEPTPQPASDLGTLAERVLAASTRFSGPEPPDDEPVTPYVAGGLGLLALALGGGFLWYRRTLP